MRYVALTLLLVVATAGAKPAESTHAADLVKDVFDRYWHGGVYSVQVEFHLTTAGTERSGTLDLLLADPEHGRVALRARDEEFSIAVQGQRVTKWRRAGTEVLFTDRREDRPSLPGQDALLGTVAFLRGEQVLTLLPMDNLTLDDTADLNGSAAWLVTGTRTLFASARGIRAVKVRRSDEYRVKETVRLWIDQDSGALLQEELTRTISKYAPADLHARFALTWQATYTKQLLSEPEEDEGGAAFVLSPPPGARRTADIEVTEALRLDPWGAAQLTSAMALGPWGGAPDFELAMLGGGTLRLSSLQGKVIFLDFWATWCGPCRRSLPHTQSLNDGFPDDLVVLTINERERPDEVRAYLRENGYAFRVAMDRAGSVGDRYGVRGIPTFVVIDRTGKLVGTVVGWGPGADEQIASLLREAGLPL